MLKTSNSLLSPRRFHADALPVEVYETNELMGRAAARAVADAIRAAAQSQDEVRIVFAAANSQLSFIEALTHDHALPWHKVVCFQMDEYIGLPGGNPASLARWIKERIAEVVHPKEVHYLDGTAPRPEIEAERYAALLRAAPIDITCLGIGENGHLAFNDPAFADFADKSVVRIVEPDELSRRQQVGEGHFASVANFPRRAFTVTIPALLSARHVFGIVPERRKASAVRNALTTAVSPHCPASILRTQPHARLFLDCESASLLESDPIAGGSNGRNGSAQHAKARVVDAILTQGFVPIFVHDTMDSRQLVEAAVAAGCRVLEYSCRRADAREIIPWIKREFPQVAVLAATLLDGERVTAHLQATIPGFLTADEAVELGADGLVSFLRFRPETYRRYGDAQVMIAGVGSPNEALDQLELGADLIKVTVGSTSGSELVTKSLVPTHGCIPFFISGGLTFENVENYIKAGVVATAAGFDLLLGRQIPPRDQVTPLVRQAISRMFTSIVAAREKHQPALAAAIRAGGSDLLSAGPWFRKPRGD